MEKETLKQFKEAAFVALKEMIDKMFSETEVNDDTITISIAGHDVKGFQYSLNQFSTEISINGNITTYPPKFIRYPEYFGKAVRTNIRKAREEIKTLEDKYAALESPEARMNFIEEHGEIGRDIWRRLRALEDGIQSLESTGFRAETIRNVLHGIRTGQDPYTPEPEPSQEETEVMPEEQPREFVNPEALGEEITEVEQQRQRLEREMRQARRRDRDPLQLERDIEHAQILMTDYFNARDIEIGYIDRIMRQDLLRMAEFENCPTDVMAREITTHNMNNPPDEDSEEAQNEIMPSVDEIIQAAQEMDNDHQESRNIHDEAALRFIERWFTTRIQNVGLIDQQEYENMRIHIETNWPPGVYMFALDRVVGAHNASITSNRVGEVDITANTVLEGTPQRIRIQDAAHRLFAHVTGCNNPETDSIGRYVDDETRTQLYDSAYRSNIPREAINVSIQLYNAIHSNEELDTREEEQSRKSDIFILSHYNTDDIINDEERLEMIHRAELFDIDTEIFISRLDEHNLEAERLQAIEGARRRTVEHMDQLSQGEADDVSTEDLEAAADRIDEITRRSLPSNETERMQRNVRLDPDDPPPIEGENEEI
jgi:hypothetical protein